MSSKNKMVFAVSVIFILANLSLMSVGEAFERNLVPSKEVAAAIAEAVLVPIYGKEVLKQRPFEVKEEAEYWLVDGTLHASKKNEISTGGTAHIEIRKKDGLLRNVFHTK